MNRRSVMVCAAALAICASAVAADLEVPLTYYRSDLVQMEGARPWGGAQVELKAEPPAGDWKLPDVGGGETAYGLVKLGDSEQLLCLVKDQDSKQFLSRLYIDANGNRDLTDDPVSKPRTADADSADFGGIDTEVTMDGGKRPYSFQVMGHNRNGSEKLADRVCFHFSTNCFYWGSFAANGASYVVMLGDADANGRFGETPKLEEDNLRGDSMLLSSGRPADYGDSVMFSQYLSLGKQLYAVKLAPDCGKLVFSPVEERLARVRLPKGFDGARLQLFDPKSACSIVAVQPRQLVTVPAGDYAVPGYVMMRRDPEGDLWRLSARCSPKDVKVQAAKGRARKLAVGEPFRPEVQVHGFQPGPQAGGKQPVQLGFVLQGQAGEQVVDLARIEGRATKCAMASRDSNRPREPKYKIANADGAEVASGRFEYG